MTRSTYTKKDTVLHTLYIVFLTVLSVLAIRSSVFLLSTAACWEDFVAGGFTVFCALLDLGVDFFECRAIGARLYMDEDGIGVKRFGRMKVFLKWKDIREIGTGSIPTPFGSKKRIYFCDRVLDETEKSDLIILKYHTVHFSYIPKEWYQSMSERLPIELPTEISKKYIK